jgi:hypothetical protein
MPNWCANDAEFINDDVAEVAKLEAHLKFLDEKDKTDNIEAGLFGYFVPRPPEFDEGESWYSWNCENWGTKWEASIYSWEKVDENTIQINFDTAWSPPIAFYEFLASNTDWSVSATYYEPGMAFVGSCVDGYDEYYQIENIEALDDVPEELIEKYNIREQMEDWEEENEDFDEESEEESDPELLAQLEELKTEFDLLNVSDEPAKNAFSDENGREWLRELLRERVVGVVFTKKDGTERVMQATLSEEFIPQADRSENSTNIRKKSDEALAVWDTEVQGWRSFRWDSVKQINFTLGE